jgi:hypothetical protein
LQSIRETPAGKINLLLDGRARCFLLFAPAPLFAGKSIAAFTFSVRHAGDRRQFRETTGCLQRNFAKSSKGNLACSCHFKTHLKFSVKICTDIHSCKLSLGVKRFKTFQTLKLLNFTPKRVNFIHLSSTRHTDVINQDGTLQQFERPGFTGGNYFRD